MPKKSKFNEHFSHAQIKKIMQVDENIGKIAQSSPVVVAKAVEEFLLDLMENSLKIAENYNSNNINPCHIKNTIQSCPELASIFGHLVENLPECKMKRTR